MAQQWTYNYDANGYLSSIIDPMGVPVGFANDPVGRPTDTLLPAPGGGVRDVHQQYDGNGNVTSITLPNSPLEQHAFDYTPVDQLTTYAPPDPGVLDGGISPLGPAAWETQSTYFADRQPKLETRPDGATIQYAYDAA